MSDQTRRNVALSGEVSQQTEVLSALAARMEPSSVTPGEAADIWVALSTMNRVISAAQLRMAARAEESEQWKQAGCRNAAEYMARETGSSQRAARDQLRASKRLRDCPRVEAALRIGQVSVDQAAVIASAVVVDPTCEGFLLEAVARVPLFRLVEMAGQIRAANDPNPTKTYERIRAERRLRSRTDAEGAWHLFGHGPADDGALITHALGPLIDEMFDQARAEGCHEHRDAYAWDAMAELVRRYLEGEDLLPADDANSEQDHQSNGAGDGDRGDRDNEDSRDGADEGTASPQDGNRAQRRRRSRANRKYLTLLRVDVTGLRNTVDPDGRYVDIPGVGTVPLSAAERLLPESLLYLVLTNGTDVVNVTNLSRRATVAQQIKLLWEQPRCLNEACGHSITQIDHRQPWAECRRTDTGNLDPLCPHCHRLKTFHGWELVDGTGPRAFVPPDDPRHPRHKLKAEAA